MLLLVSDARCRRRSSKHNDAANLSVRLSLVSLTGSGEAARNGQSRRRCIGIQRPVATEFRKTISANMGIEGNEGEWRHHG